MSVHHLMECIKQNPNVKVFYKQVNIREYKAVFCAMYEAMHETYQYSGVLYMRLEMQRPFSNDVSWQFSDWENTVASQGFCV